MLDVAMSMEQSGTLMAAATIANALKEARRYEGEDEMKERLRRLVL